MDDISSLISCSRRYRKVKNLTQTSRHQKVLAGHQIGAELSLLRWLAAHSCVLAGVSYQRCSCDFGLKKHRIRWTSMQRKEFGELHSLLFYLG